MRKHLFLYVFIGFPMFFRRRKQIASPFILCLPCSKKIKGNGFIRFIWLAGALIFSRFISDKSDKSVSFFYSTTEITKETKAFVYSVSSVFMFILTTDFQDLTDVNHERKRDNPFNLCYLCSKKIKETDLSEKNYWFNLTWVRRIQCKRIYDAELTIITNLRNLFP